MAIDRSRVFRCGSLVTGAEPGFRNHVVSLNHRNGTRRLSARLCYRPHSSPCTGFTRIVPKQRFRSLDAPCRPKGDRSSQAGIDLPSYCWVGVRAEDAGIEATCDVSYMLIQNGFCPQHQIQRIVVEIWSARAIANVIRLFCPACPAPDALKMIRVVDTEVRLTEMEDSPGAVQGPARRGTQCMCIWSGAPAPAPAARPIART